MSKRVIALLLGACGALGVGSAVGTAGGADEAPAPTQTASAGSDSVSGVELNLPKPSEIDPILRAHYAVLRQPTRSIAGPGFAVAQASVINSQGINTDLAHVIPASHGAIAVVPGDGVLCLGSSFSAGCPNTAAADSGKAYVEELCSPNLPVGTNRLFGLLPDGAAEVTVLFSDGTKRSVDLSNNTYVLESAKLPQTLEWRQGDSWHHEPLPSAAAPGCGG